MRVLRWTAIGLVASLFVVDPGGLSPAGPARFAALALALGVGGTVALGVVRRSQTFGIRGPLALWGAMLGLTALSCFTAVDRWHAVFGSPERQLGLLAWIGFLAAFVMGLVLGLDFAVPLARAATVATAALGALAVAEVAGSGVWGTTWPGARVGVPFGQSTYLAAALVFLVPQCVGYTVESVGNRVTGPRPASPMSVTAVRVTAVGMSLVGVAALLATQSRGPILGLGAALAMVAAGLAKRDRAAQAADGRDGSHPWAVGAALGSTLVAVVVISQRRGWDVIGGRIDEWRVGVRGVIDRPWLGAGPEGYRATFPSLVDADYVRRYGVDVVTDRAHNALLDTALSSGPMAAAMLGALWCVVVRAVWHGLVAEQRPRPVELGLSVGVLALLAQQLVLFPLAEIDPLLWLGSGMIVSGSRREPRPDAAGTGGMRRADAVDRGAGAMIAAALAVSFWWSSTSAVGEHRITATDSFRQDTAESATDRALAWRPEAARLVFAASLIYSDGPALTDLDQALLVIERGLDRHPDEPTLNDEYVRLLVERARRSGLENDAKAAIGVIDRRLGDAPHSPVLLGRLAEALLLAGRRQDALSAVDRAVELDPDDQALRALREFVQES